LTVTETAILLVDRDFALRRYTAPSSFIEDRASIREASMQISSMLAKTSSGNTSYWTAVDRIAVSTDMSVTISTRAQIFVAGLPSLRHMILQVNADDMIKSVKDQVEERIGLDLEFRLAYKGQALRDDFTIRECGIQPLSTLICISLRPRSASAGPWYSAYRNMIVKTLIGKTLDFSVEFCQSEGRMTVRKLMQLIEAKKVYLCRSKD
jgi:hypothetical protein